MSDAIDALLHDSLVATSAYLDLDVAAAAIGDALRALGKQAKALAEAEYAARTVTLRCPGCARRHEYQVPAKPEDIARAAAHTAKVTDEITRLAAFAKGQPDSRPDLGHDVLRALTPEQIRVVEGWVAENARR